MYWSTSSPSSRAVLLQAEREQSDVWEPPPDRNLPLRQELFRSQGRK